MELVLASCGTLDVHLYFALQVRLWQNTPLWLSYDPGLSAMVVLSHSLVQGYSIIGAAPLKHLCTWWIKCLARELGFGSAASSPLQAVL